LLRKDFLFLRIADIVEVSSNLLNRVQNAEEPIAIGCDARNDDGSNAAGTIKFFVLSFIV